MLENIRGLILDMDGVLWRAGEILPGTPEFFQYIHQRVPYVFATNNSTRTIQYYCEKLSNLGIPVKPSQIVSSALATAAYLAMRYPPHTQIFVVGESGLKATLRDYGFTLIGAGGGHPALVVVGLDRTINYDKIHIAANYVRAGARLIATNPDRTFPIPNGQSPGAGTMVAAVEAASGGGAMFIGKPESPMYEVAMKILGTQPEQTMMIGDRLETDIWGASKMGMKSALMLSGISSEQDIMTIKPDAVYANLAALLADYRLKLGE